MGYRASYASGSRMSGQYLATSGLMAANAESSVAVAHGLGVTPTDVLVNGVEDGFFSNRVTFRVARDATNVTVVFYNNSGIANVQALLRFRCLY